MFNRLNSSRMVPPRGGKRQRGFLMMEVSLALLVAAGAASLAFVSAQRADEATSAMTQADNLVAFRDAAETLVQENYIQYQAGQAITRNGVTLPAGVAAGQSYQPTTAILRTMGLGIDTASDLGFYKSLANANYLIRIRREPAGCELAPNPLNGSLCNITGLICFDRPVQPYGAPVGGDIDGFALGKMLGKLGGNGGASIPGYNANIIGTGSSYTIPNPIAGAPSGIVCSRFGFGSSGFGSFLRVNDTRDPGFQGGMTVNGLNSSANTLQINGNAGLAGNLTVTGSSTAGSFTTPGSSTAGSFTTAGISTAGSFTTAGTATAGKVQISDIVTVNTACTINGLVAKDASGQLMSCQSNVWKVQGDGRCVANFSDLNFLQTDGRCYNGQGNPNSPAGADWFFVEVYRHVNPGNFYTVQLAYGMTGAAVGRSWARNQQSGTSGTGWGPWVPTGYPFASVGTPCPTEGQISQSPSGSNLVCNGSIYRNVNDLFGRQGIFNIALYGNGDVVANPVCGPSMTPTIVPLGVVSACVVGGGICANNTGSFRGSVNPGNVVLITGSDGSLAGNARMTVGAMCSTF